MNRLYFVFFIFVLLSCSSKVITYNELNSFDEHNQLQAVIENPQGTNAVINYNSTKNRFEQDTINGRTKEIEFLAYPVNMGFIPSTHIDDNRKDSHKNFDVLVLGEVLKTGQIVSVKPIGILRLKENGKLNQKILSIPIDKDLQTLNIKNFKDLSKNHSKVREMIGEWFQFYDKSSNVEILGWSDEKMALKEVKKSQISNPNKA